MVKQAQSDAAEFIHSLNMNGLHGRMLVAPASNKRAKREILLLYGHHAQLERWWGLVQNLQTYGPVTMPDLPGFGGMDPFTTIGQKPTIDAYADYLASFIKLRFKKRPITIVGVSFGFVVATRMLQKYPEIAGRVNLVVSMVGFMHKDDFLYSPTKRRVFRGLTRLIAARPLPSINKLLFREGIIGGLYARLGNGKIRLAETSPEFFKELVAYETKLWRMNDVRTHWLTTHEFLNLDNCGKKLDMDVWHVAASHDTYFNNEFVEQHMRVVFADYHRSTMHSKSHTPHLLGDKKDMAVMVPPPLRARLRRKV